MCDLLYTDLQVSLMFGLNSDCTSIVVNSLHLQFQFTLLFTLIYFFFTF